MLVLYIGFVYCMLDSCIVCWILVLYIGFFSCSQVSVLSLSVARTSVIASIWVLRRVIFCWSVGPVSSIMSVGGAVVGEGGEPEYLIPSSKMNSAMMRWSAGQSGSQVLADGGEMINGGGGSALGDQPPQINISGGTTVINNEEFVRMDQIPAIVAQSAQAGEAKTLRRLRMSPGTRRQTGI